MRTSAGREPARRRAPRPKAATRRRDGRRLRDPVSWWRRLRSVIELVLTTVVLGVVLATILALGIAAVVLALQHALNG